MPACVTLTSRAISTLSPHSSKKAGDTGSEPAATSQEAAPSPSTVEEGGEPTEKSGGNKTEGAADGVAGNGETEGTETSVAEPDGKDATRKVKASAE